MKSVELSLIVLSGGLGTRVKNILGDIPKILAPINNYTFFDYFYKWIKSSLNEIDFDVTLATGYGHNILKDYCSQKYPEVNLVYEKVPLGTFGAAANASLKSSSNNILILNGDTIFDSSLQNIFEEFLTNRTNPLAIVKKVISNERYGGYDIFDNKLIINPQEPAYISMGGTFSDKRFLVNHYESQKRNGNILMMDNHFISKVETRPFVLEENTKFIDIGTPKSFEFSQKFIPDFLKSF